MFKDFVEKIIEKINLEIGRFGLIAIRFLITIIVGFIVLKIVKIIIRKIVKRTKLESIVVSFILSFINCILYLVYIFFILASLNIPTTSLAAIVASSGVAVGLALKDSLSNIANGIVILIIKPFKEGDYVSIGGTDGTVTEINIATTVLTTPDNKVIILPNSNVSTQNVVNYSRNNLRRLELTFNISYDYDVTYIKSILQEIVDVTNGVSDEKAPTIVVGSIEKSFAVYYLRVWVKTSNFWDIKWKMQEDAIEIFKNHNVKFEIDKFNVKLNENIE